MSDDYDEEVEVQERLQEMALDNDVVRRLRAYDPSGGAGCRQPGASQPPPPEACLDAADEIESLRRIIATEEFAQRGRLYKFTKAFRRVRLAGAGENKPEDPCPVCGSGDWSCGH